MLFQMVLLVTALEMQQQQCRTCALSIILPEPRTKGDMNTENAEAEAMRWGVCSNPSCAGARWGVSAAAWSSTARSASGADPVTGSAFT